LKPETGKGYVIKNRGASKNAPFFVRCSKKIVHRKRMQIIIQKMAFLLGDEVS
jgi:hypothetical protein